MGHILVTGGSRGIGKAVVESLITEKKSIIYTYANENPNESFLKQKAKENGVDCFSFKVDQKNNFQVEKFCNQLISEYSDIEAIILNAGISQNSLVANITDKQWNEVIETNLYGPFYYLRNMYNYFISKGEGTVITVSSMAAINGSIGAAAYAASKGGIIGLAKSVGKEMARFGIKSYIIAPGYVETDMTANLNMKKTVSKILMGRLGTPQEIADLIAYLITKKNFFQNNIFTADGGNV
ncbi:SDR family NAD(P)-dependent oxidoreductase [Paenibacillus tundrae]|uniref:SDR family NAD(P)-dependent oxidoreductase n=1 Tax=Paenibacillus tundrae TaxID=528187 RepID=UPI0022A8E070|nr:SDR family NAD(P)-dependent oxidoreductase [Paenibacillus tundrae]MCZ1264774.1 SDR family NAD(P)-dependent oxidoreductase [Paenibacillus tundrae]